ncbi:hypothetical protein KL943_003237 [Ogataea angusta]|nr:hypothetical protein KL943_003237 [Ogataea angusta]
MIIANEFAQRYGRHNGRFTEQTPLALARQLQRWQSRDEWNCGPKIAAKEPDDGWRTISEKGRGSRWSSAVSALMDERRLPPHTFTGRRIPWISLFDDAHVASATKRNDRRGPVKIIELQVVLVSRTQFVFRQSS